METKNIDLNKVEESLASKLDTFNITNVERESAGVLRFDHGNEKSFWLYVTGASVSGQRPRYPIKLHRILAAFGFTSFDWE